MTSRFWFISGHHAVYGVKRLCRILNVSRSAFYRWRRSAPERAARADQDAQLVERIRAVHADSGGTYGSPRIHAELRAAGVRVFTQRGRDTADKQRLYRTLADAWNAPG